MKIVGKSLFTIQSVGGGKPEVKPEIQTDLDLILELMKKHSITEIVL